MMENINPRKLLFDLFQSAIKSASPENCLTPNLTGISHPHVHVIGAGKAAAAMARVIENNIDRSVSGIVVTRYGHSVALDSIEAIEAGHPIPDELGVVSATKIANLATSLNDKDLIICVVSGGASALLSLPHFGIAFEDKKRITRDLLMEGATIQEINCVRKHLSAIKGGRLMRLIYPAQALTYCISDVVGDDPSIIGSGPTVADSSTCKDVLKVLSHYNIEVPEYLWRMLERGQIETPKPDDPVFERSVVKTIARPIDALSASAEVAKNQGFQAILLGDLIQGETNLVAKRHAAFVRERIADSSQAKPCVIISGGETTVAVSGSGKGGPNTQYVLALALELEDIEGVYAIACDTDGIDGSEDNAGALLTPSTLTRAQVSNLEARKFLNNNDSYSFFEKLGDLVVTGPTLTNVNDFRAICYIPGIY